MRRRRQPSHWAAAGVCPTLLHVSGGSRLVKGGESRLRLFIHCCWDALRCAYLFVDHAGCVQLPLAYCQVWWTAYLHMPGGAATALHLIPPLLKQGAGPLGASTPPEKPCPLEPMMSTVQFTHTTVSCLRWTGAQGLVSVLPFPAGPRSHRAGVLTSIPVPESSLLR